MTDIRLSYSSLNSHRRCPRQFALRYISGIVQDGPPSVQRALGSWLHAFVAVHNLRQGLKHESLIVVPKALDIIDGLIVDLDISEAGSERMGVIYSFEDEDGDADWFPLAPSGVATLCAAWWSQQTEDWQARFEEKYGESLPDRVTNMWRRYRLHWAHTDETRIPLLVEYEWQRNLTKTGDLPPLNGRTDLVYLDLQKNLVVISDTKTCASFGRDTEQETAMWDSQLNLQLWGIRTLVQEAKAAGHKHLQDRDLNFALEYDRARTKRPSQPKLVKNRSKGGPEFVKSKAACDTDAYTYRRWLETEDAQQNEIALDEEYLAELEADTKRWFRRGVIPENPFAVRVHLKAALHDVGRIADLTLETAVPLPTTMGCGSCEYRDLCAQTLMGVRIEDVNLADLGLRHKGDGEPAEEYVEEGEE
jgi:hypothetical protein